MAEIVTRRKRMPYRRGKDLFEETVSKIGRVGMPIGTRTGIVVGMVEAISNQLTPVMIVATVMNLIVGLMVEPPSLR